MADDFPNRGNNFQRVPFDREMAQITISAYNNAIRQAEAAGRDIREMVKARDELRARYQKETGGEGP